MRLHIKNSGTESTLVKFLLTSSFGVSSASFKTVKEGYTTVINFPVYLKKAITDIGGYDISLHRNQDNDLNQRLFEKGHKLYHTEKTGCDYTPPDTLKKLYKYAYKNGFWNAKSLMLKPSSMKIHHVIPFFFVLSVIFPLLAFVTGHFTGFNFIFSLF